MAIKNTYAKLGAGAYLTQIQDALVAHGAVGMQMMYDTDRRISSLQFALPFKDGKNISFALPCEWRKFQQVLINQNAHRCNDDEYAYKVAWANLKDWVLAQMALYETEIVTMPQIFLPFAVDHSGRTFYEIASSTGLLLGDGKQ